MKKSLVTIFIVVGAMIVLSLIWMNRGVVKGYDACVKLGGEILGAEPATCITKDGQSWLQIISNQHELRDLIHVNTPTISEMVANPLIVTGEARGTWFFEASFGIKLLDHQGNIIGTGVAMAENDWMTEELVPFTAEIVFDWPESEHGLLVLEKEDPSGLFDPIRLLIPVNFDLSNTQPVLLYYYDPSLDPNANCDKDAVGPVLRRINKNVNEIETTLNLLLSGRIFDEEKDRGMETEFPLSGLKLIKVEREGGELKVFLDDPEFATSGGACRSGLLRTQIEKTALQFSNVNQVIIEPEELFQP